MMSYRLMSVLVRTPTFEQPVGRNPFGFLINDLGNWDCERIITVKIEPLEKPESGKGSGKPIDRIVIQIEIHDA